MVVPSPSAADTVVVGHNTATPVRTSSTGSLGKANPLKNIIRRKSLELGRFFDGSAGSSSQRNGSRASLEQDASQSAPPLSLDSRRAGTPTPTSPPRSTTRRPNFTLGLPWRPQSEYFSQGSPGVQTSLSKSQKRFVRAFPELADLTKVPAAYCLPCLATPPHTPPEHPLTPGSTSLSASNTLSTLTSSVFSTTSSTTTLACQGHFHDYSCALEREILWQGTLYVATTHVCFYGKHFGKTVKVIIDYRDLVLIEREKKMGVFPSSIRLRVSLVETNPTTSAARNSQETKRNTNTDTNTNNNDAGAAEPNAPVATKDYVLTSLMSREQAFAEIERNWQAQRHFHRSACTNSLPTPQFESPGGSERNLAGLADSGDGRGSTLELDSRIKPWTILDRHKVPRTYSVTSDEVFSSSVNLDRPHLRERASTSLIRPSTPVSHEHIGSWRAAAAATGASSDHPSQSSGIPASVSEGRRGSVASIGSSDKQELTSGLIGFLQRRSSLVHKWRKSESGGGGNFSDSSSETAQDHRDDVTPSPVDVSLAATAVTTTQSSTFQDSPLLAAQRQDEALMASTPPSTLISPSLTTTKVSRSLSTVQTDGKPGSTHGMTKHIRGESNDGLEFAPDERGTTSGQAIMMNTISSKANTNPSNFSTPPLPSGPVSCGCSRHYKNAVVSTVVPLPVDLCFEILFSGAGAGLGDNLGCNTHRIKDGSTDILIMPWQHEDQLQDGDRAGQMGWVDQQRRLEYSVSFKVPMLAKTSTACFETQRVTQHEPFAILVHSESKTPNVPYGDHFSTVNQICMTWESEGKTKIKCFTEVKFKRSIMWSSKVEAGSLEGSGGFYKEFIRQFEQLVESQREHLLSSYEARKSTSSSSSSFSSSSLVVSPVADNRDFTLGTRACTPIFTPATISLFYS
ncbi:hypothetical protein EC957_003292 [Mortierella hygrophila]|uniref:VASt domain-containing protein n=1 Tax=Mortierella hygrophila TaxID=979708 RepID=A0A9P6F256_9FUNG|nr:hypothetical protein EC957_003292 [Mortierella hygrophila]